MDVGAILFVLASIFTVLIVVLAIASGTIIRDYERGVVLTLGRFAGIRHPGLRFIIPALQKIERVDMREDVVDIPPQDIITKDNILVKVNGVVYYKVRDPRIAILDVANFKMSTREMAQVTLRASVGDNDLDDLSNPQGIAGEVKQALEIKTREWGVTVSNVEIKEINIDPEMMQSIARQAKAERMRRAVVIEASGERQAAHDLKEAADILASSPGAMHLRTLATLTNVSGNSAATVVFPIPMDMGEMLGKFADVMKPKSPSKDLVPTSADLVPKPNGHD